MACSRGRGWMCLHRRYHTPSSPPLTLSPCSFFLDSRSRFSDSFADFAGAALSAAELCNLLSPQGLEPTHMLSKHSGQKHNKSGNKPRRDNSPIISALEYNTTMDAATVFGTGTVASPCAHSLVQPHRSPLSPMQNQLSYERRNTKSPFRSLQSRCLIID